MRPLTTGWRQIKGATNPGSRQMQDVDKFRTVTNAGWQQMQGGDKIRARKLSNHHPPMADFFRHRYVRWRQKNVATIFAATARNGGCKNSSLVGGGRTMLSPWICRHPAFLTLLIFSPSCIYRHPGFAATLSLSPFWIVATISFQVGDNFRVATIPGRR